MSKQTEALKLALEALEGLEALLLSMGLTHLIVYGDAEKAITNLQKELEDQPAQQEPVTYWDLSENEMPVRPRLYDPEEHPNHVPLYTTPPAQPQQEPVAWESMLGAIARGWCHEKNANKEMDADLVYAIATEINALYTTPLQRKPLTDEEIWREYQARWPFHPAEEPRLAADLVTFARAIEAAHGIKENT